MKKEIFYTFIFASLSCLADKAYIKAMVLDGYSELPIQGVEVKAWFEVDIGWRAWSEPTPIITDVKTTDSQGICGLEGKTNVGHISCEVVIPPFGYYGAYGGDFQFNRKSLFGVWQPDNLVVTIKLQRVEHPIPLFVKQLFSRGSDSVRSNYFDIGKGQMKFDLIKGDWLPPIGKGEYADIVFTRLEREDLGIGTTFRGSITAPAYRDGMSIRFTGEDNGLVEVPSKKTAGIKIRTAPEDGYTPDYLVTKGRDKNVKYFSSSNPDRNFAFRIRTKKDKNGKIVAAYYGKIYGDIEIKKFSFGLEVPVAAPSFMYYLNPTPLDRNLEWDMKTNLCPNPGSISKEP
jgi:hypothetical protein